jgi:deoxyribodipyrimidine photo-lyase
LERGHDGNEGDGLHAQLHAHVLGEKILEWRRTPQEAWATLLELNNRYFLDGRDPSSYAGAGWVFGLHDRPWGERGIYGTVRTMTASGLERKCDIRAYVEKVNGSVDRAGLG